METGLAALFKGASMKVADEASIDDWIDDDISAGGCYVPRSQRAEIIIDGRSGRVSDECPDKVVATVVAGGRLYLFALCTTARTRGPSSTPSPPRSTCVPKMPWSPETA